MMKNWSYIKNVLFVLSLLLGIFVFSEKVYAYPCPVGMSCSPYGSINGGVWVGYGEGNNRVCWERDGYTIRYSCSGTDANCEGGVWYWRNEGDCMTQDNAEFAGCCGGPGGGGGGQECGCGSQQCENTPGCECTFYGCKMPDGGNCAEYSCNTCDDGPCTPASCPAPLITEQNDYLAGTTSCSNCAGSNSRNCYEVPSASPISSIEVFPTGVANNMGCVSMTHTGMNMNRTIRMRSAHTDPDGAGNIEAVYVWLKNQPEAPNTPKYIDLDSNSGQTGRVYTNWSYGFMMHKEQNGWVPYIPSLQDNANNNKWIKADYSGARFGVKGPSGQNIVEVVVNSVTSQGNTVLFDFNLDYRNIPSGNLPQEGIYNIFVMANDEFGFTPYDNYTNGAQDMIDDTYPNNEQIRFYDRWTDSTRDWLYDFTSPTVDNMTSQVEYPTYLQYSWSSNDISSNGAGGLYALVTNAYISDGVPLTETDTISETLLTARGIKTIAPQPYTLSYTPQNINLIGNLNSAYLAKSVGVNAPSDLQAVRVNTRSNREGSLIVYATAFDNACNYGAFHNLYNLEDWIITYGGLMYSENGVEFTAKNVVESTLWDPFPFLRKITPLHADITSELFSGNTAVRSTILDKLVRTTELRSYAINPFSAYKTINFYTDLKSTFERRELGISGVQRIPNTSSLIGNLTNYGTGEVNVLDRSGNLTVGNNNVFNCNGRGVFFVSGNLIIQNGITNSNRNKDACLFVVGGNVIINSGSNKSSPTSMGYDEINAYILVDGNVTINADTSYDGLYINGGIHSRDGMTMNRYLGINYRNTYPALIVDHHSKYGLFSSLLLGSPVDMVKTEVGFKPY